MPGTEKIYRRTESGLRAYGDPNSGLSNHHRAILELLEADSHLDLIRARLKRRYSEKQVLDLLDELQALGLLESQATTAHHDLDFTGEFSLAALRGSQGAA